MNYVLTAIMSAIVSIMITLVIVDANYDYNQRVGMTRFAECIAITGETTEGYRWCMEQIYPKLLRYIDATPKFEEAPVAE